MGVHSPEEVSQFGCTDLKVLSDTLADKPFFFGDEPTTVSVVNPLTHLPVRGTMVVVCGMRYILTYPTSYIKYSFSYL